MKTHSRIFRGEVAHRRLAPVEHGFRYPVCFYCFELSELPRLDREVSGFGYNRLRPVALHDRDYLEPSDESLGVKLRRWLAHHGVDEGIERVELITAARCFNYVFNPVSFYLCHTAARELCCIVAEVNNTFGDRHLYLVRDLRREGDTWRAATRQLKLFHVSPFNDMEGEYAFRLERSEGGISISVDMYREGRLVFTSALRGTGVPLTTAALWRALARYPATAALTLPRIAKQAALLRFRRRLRVFARPEPRSENTIIRRAPSRWERFAMNRFLARMAHLREGELTLILPDGSRQHFGVPGDLPPATLTVNRYRFFTRLALAGDIGFGEGFTADDYDSPDVAQVLKICLRNSDALSDSRNAMNALRRALDATRHALRLNTRRRSRRNIHAHYDLGNDFFRLFLDPTLTYSCGIFRSADDTLEQAQKNKMDAMIEKTGLAPDHHVLEIGSGWGSLAIEMARRSGCRVTSITLSQEQQKLASERVRRAGLEDQVEIRLCDYRAMDGRFDRIVSVEMLEAVGHRYLGAFFRKCDALLKPGGRLVAQAITCPDYWYDDYRRGSDWIRKYIFPGGHLPSLGAIISALRARTRLTVEHLEDIGPHYVRTLREWNDRFLRSIEQVEALGLDRTFQRTWLYYLAYCEAGFDERFLRVLQLVMTRAGERSGISSRPTASPGAARVRARLAAEVTP